MNLNRAPALTRDELKSAILNSYHEGLIGALECRGMLHDLGVPADVVEDWMAERLPSETEVESGPALVVDRKNLQGYLQLRSGDVLEYQATSTDELDRWARDWLSIITGLRVWEVPDDRSPSERMRASIDEARSEGGRVSGDGERRLMAIAQRWDAEVDG